VMLRLDLGQRVLDRGSGVATCSMMLTRIVGSSAPGLDARGRAGFADPPEFRVGHDPLRMKCASLKAGHAGQEA